MDRSLLIDCAACGGKLSRKAVSCRACGHPNARVTWQAVAAVGIALVVVASLFVWRIHRHNTQLSQQERALLQQVITDYQSLPQDAPSQVRCSNAQHVATLADQYQPELAGRWQEIAAVECGKGASIGI